MIVAKEEAATAGMSIPTKKRIANAGD